MDFNIEIDDDTLYSYLTDDSVFEDDFVNKINNNEVEVDDLVVDFELANLTIDHLNKLNDLNINDVLNELGDKANNNNKQIDDINSCDNCIGRNEKKSKAKSRSKKVKTGKQLRFLLRKLNRRLNDKKGQVVNEVYEPMKTRFRIRQSANNETKSTTSKSNTHLNPHLTFNLRSHSTGQSKPRRHSTVPNSNFFAPTSNFSTNTNHSTLSTVPKTNSVITRSKSVSSKTQLLIDQMKSFSIETFQLRIPSSKTGYKLSTDFGRKYFINRTDDRKKCLCLVCGESIVFNTFVLSKHIETHLATEEIKKSDQNNKLKSLNVNVKWKLLTHCFNKDFDKTIIKIIK